jgi:hypothetical protein
MAVTKKVDMPKVSSQTLSEYPPPVIRVKGNTRPVRPKKAQLADGFHHGPEERDDAGVGQGHGNGHGQQGGVADELERGKELRSHALLPPQGAEGASTSPGPGRLAQGDADQMISASATQKAVTMSRNGWPSTWLGKKTRRTKEGLGLLAVAGCDVVGAIAGVDRATETSRARSRPGGSWRGPRPCRWLPAVQPSRGRRPSRVPRGSWRTTVPPAIS